MKYLYWLLLCLILARCETAKPPATGQVSATPQVTATWSSTDQLPVGVLLTDESISDVIIQILDYQTISNVVVQEIPGLKNEQIFIFLLNGDHGVGLGMMKRKFDPNYQQVRTTLEYITQWPVLTEPPVTQFQLRDQDAYVVYGYMPTNLDSMAKIFLKNGQVIWFTASSGLQLRLLPLENPALKVQILDSTEQLIAEHNLFYE